MAHSAPEAAAQAGRGDSVTGWKLDRDQRRELLQQFPPRYRNVVADHVTLQARAADDAPLPQETDGEIVGRADDGKGVEAMIVAIDGTVAWLRRVKITQTTTAMPVMSAWHASMTVAPNCAATGSAITTTPLHSASTVSAR